MNCYSYELNSGYFVSFIAFALHLKDMSHDQHQWGIVPIPGIFPSSKGYPRSYVLVGYSNSGAPNFLNALCFILPVVALGGNAGSEPELIVSFSSLSITPLTKGLYIEDGSVKYSLLEDWERVWYPIRRQLWPETNEYCVSAQDLQWYEDVTAKYQDMILPLPEDGYREQFLSFLSTMAESLELIQEALN
jgi:hypothetical protein